MTNEKQATLDPTDLLEALLVKFAAAEASWFSSVRPDGRVHSAPIWHVWHEGCAYVCTPDGAVRTKNVAANPSVSLALPNPYNVFIIEGTAELAAKSESVQPLFYQKYDWDIAEDVEYNTVLRIIPKKILAWGDHGEGRWRF